MIREVDQQDAVLRDEADQHDRPDQREEVERLVRDRERSERADRSNRDRKHDDDRQDVAIVERDHQQVHEREREHQRQAQTADRVREVLLLAASVRDDVHGVRQMQRRRRAAETRAARSRAQFPAWCLR